MNFDGGTDKMSSLELKNQIIGTWQLIAAELESEDGGLIYPFGNDATGLLMYDALGNMTVQIARKGRNNFASGYQFTGSVDEIKNAFEGYLAYFGTYEIKYSENIILHNINASLFPNWSGIEQKRFFEINNNKLVLRTEPILIDNKQQTGILKWQKYL